MGSHDSPRVPGSDGRAFLHLWVPGSAALIASKPHGAVLDDGAVRLSAPGVELIVDVDAGYPNVLHWGAPLSSVNVGNLRAAVTRAAPGADLDDPVEPGMLREGARGFVGRPALRGHRGAQGFSPLFEVEAVMVDAATCTVQMADAAVGLALRLTFTMTEYGVLLIDQSLTNAGSEVHSLDELSTWLPVPDRATHTLDFTGRWLRERQPQRLPFVPGLRLREGREGRSGHDHTIVQCALTADATTEHGEVWALGLLWSGGVRHLAERDTHGRGALGAGELLEPGEAELGPGEAYTAPTVAAFYSDAGLDGISASSHAWLRSRPGRAASARPLTLNVWEAVYFDHDLATLSALADRAAAVGVERFVLDDGWFGSRRDDTSGLGDWVVSSDAWPTGLGQLVEHVRGLGMQFGLWFEGEMISPDSDLYRAHPEWILRVPGREPPLARSQQVLDLVNPDAYAHVLEAVSALVGEYGIDYLKWDHNRALTDAGHAGAPASRRQTLAIYELFDELKGRHPGLEIESCASGGGRIDLGMAFHADRFWTSDQNDPLERQHIQRWTSLVIPPEMLGSHVGPTTSHTTGRTHGVGLRAATALFGHAGLEWNLLDASDDEVEALTRFAALYREQRPLLHSGRMVRVEHPDPAALVHGVVAADASRGLFAYVQVATSAGVTPAAMRMPGLEFDSLYRVRVRDVMTGETVQRRAPAWVDGIELTGATLAQVGVQPPILRPEQATLIEVVRVDAGNGRG